jgi:predicted nucleic acid-binding protein
MRYFLDTNICIYALKNKFPPLSHGATLVTHNKNEFKRVEDLMVEDWTG